MLLALAQINPVVGDVEGNTALIVAEVARAREAGAQLLVLPELCVCGYPPRDLLFRSGFAERCMRAVEVVAGKCGLLTVVLGTPWPSAGGRGLHNSAAVVRDGAIIARHDKILLPGYDVFDEDRYFEPGAHPTMVDVAGVKVGVLICEDLWRGADAGQSARYGEDPATELVRAGCRLIVAPNASPFVIGKGRRHAALLAAAAKRLDCALAVVNQVGANDDLVFDGRSTFVRPGGPPYPLAGFCSGTALVELDGDAAPRVVDADGRGDLHGEPVADAAVRAGSNGGSPGAPLTSKSALSGTDDHDDPQCETFLALRCALSDYVRKTGHKDVLVGLSGGIDSALTAALAAAALGGDRVHGVLMPSRYSSPGSLIDARETVRRLGMPEAREIPIESLHDAGESLLRSAVPDFGRGIGAENLQSRLRGLILMALSNETGALVLPTSNKSELAVGYATLYGDMCGALCVLGDLTKSRVYALSRWMNEHHRSIGFGKAPIPEASIEKPPSAELRPDQLDADSLPPYAVLDELVERVVEGEEDPVQLAQDIAGRGLVSIEDATRICRLIDLAEFKRFQSAIIPKVTPRTFGRGRPMPLVGR